MRRLVPATLVLLATGCAARTPIIDPGVRTCGGEVVLIGDSILGGARDVGGPEEALTELTWTSEIIAEGSRMLGWAPEVVEARTSAGPRDREGSRPRPVP